MRRSWMIGWVLVAVTGLAHGQSWREAYDSGLKALKSGNYAEAKKSFKQASAYRPEDVSAPTILPGPISEQRKWRDGAPFSPNFLAAYAAYRQSALPSEESKRVELLNEAATNFEALVAKKQYSYETLYFLSTVYTSLSATEKRIKLEETYTALGGKVNWKVDTDGLTPDEVATINQSFKGQAVGETTIPIAPVVNAGSTSNPNVPTTFAGRVAPIASKYALVIGNSSNRLADLSVPFSSDNAQLVREALVTYAGYPEQNVDVVVNATADQIRASAKALADRMQTDASTICIYYSGVGSNLGGKDYLAGVDTELATDTSTMVAKTELYKVFMDKGARIFAFFETNRPIVEGRYFGMEVPMFGTISQTQATLPGQSIFSTTQNGKQIGIFADSIRSVLMDLRSNQLPITEFGWQLFYKMRRGNTGVEGGSGSQTPTLPVLTNMASEAKF